MDISIIIACYNGADILEKGVSKIDGVLSKTNYTYEIIFVDDKSTDNTQKIIKDLVEGHKNRIALFHTVNEGRGKTVSKLYIPLVR